MRKARKGQMQMGETIAVIIVVIFLIVLGLVFYSKIKAQSLQEKKVVFEELDVVKLSQLSYSLPEIQCSFAEVSEHGCIDLLKFNYLAEMINNSYTSSSDKTAYFYYRELFGTSRISLQIINNTGFASEKELYETNRSWTIKNTVYMPTNIYNPITQKNSFGVLVVEKYG